MSTTMKNITIEETLERLTEQISFLAYKFHKSLHITIEDAKQTARVAVLLAYNKNVEILNIENFYFSVINKYFIDEIRKLSTKKRRLTVASETSNLAVSRETVAEQLLTEDYISEFTPDKKQIIKMLLVGHTLREIASTLDISLGTCHNLLQQIRLQINSPQSEED